MCQPSSHALGLVSDHSDLAPRDLPREGASGGGHVQRVHGQRDSDPLRGPLRLLGQVSCSPQEPAPAKQVQAPPSSSPGRVLASQAAWPASRLHRACQGQGRPPPDSPGGLSGPLAPDIRHRPSLWSSPGRAGALPGLVREEQEHSWGNGPDPHSRLWLLCSFNLHTEQVDTHCGCCHPVSSYEKRFVLPCSDPAAQGQQLVLTVQMFGSCACGPRRCGG